MYILSDIHGQKHALSWWLHHTQEKYCIQLGDFGFVFSDEVDIEYESNLDLINNMIEKKDRILFTILGNHDCWPRYYKMEVVEMFGAKCWKLRSSIYAVQPGEILDIEGKTFLCIGGADSHDKEWRIQYELENKVKVWWKEEQIAIKDIDNAISNLKAREYKVDYICTHCEPATFILKSYLFQNPQITISEKMLDRVLEVAEFKMWYGGHVHTDKQIETGGKKICSLGIDKAVKI